MSQRTDRLDSQIRQELMDLMQREMQDPRIGFATITRSSTARDLAMAASGERAAGPRPTMEGTLKPWQRTPWLRRRLGERLTCAMSRMPCALDDSIAPGDRCMRIILERDLDQAGEGQMGARRPAENPAWRRPICAFCHENPDGDALGAAIAITIAG